MSNLLTYLNSKTEKHKDKPGFIMRIPYLLILRTFIILGILLRFQMHKGEYNTESNEWLVLNSLIIASLIVLVFSYFLTYNKIRHKFKFQLGIIIFEILTISFFYYSTKTLESDFYLFYYLPILSTTEYFNRIHTFIISIAISSVYIVLLILMSTCDPLTFFKEVFLRIYMPREVFFIGITSVIAYTSNADKKLKFRLKQYMNQMQSLIDYKTEVEHKIQIEDIFQLTLSHAKKTLDVYLSFIRIDYGNSNKILSEPNHETNDSIIQYAFSADVEYDEIIKSRTIEDDGQKLCLLKKKIIDNNDIKGDLALIFKEKEEFIPDSIKFIENLIMQNRIAIKNFRLVTGLEEIISTITNITDLNDEINNLLQNITEDIGFDYCVLSLVDKYKNVVETFRSKNSSKGITSKICYPLDSNQDYMNLVNTKSFLYKDSHDNMLNCNEYNEAGNANYTKLLLPIEYCNEVVGTMEVGLFNESACKRINFDSEKNLKSIIAENAKLVANARPHIIMELISSHATKIINADSSSIHIYDEDLKNIVYIAGNGWADKTFLSQFPPRPNGIGIEAIETKKIVIIDDEFELKKRNPKAHEIGIRSIAAFPLVLSNKLKGVLYIHFWKKHQFLQSEIDLEKIFVNIMASVIHETSLIFSISEKNHTVWRLTELINMIQSLSTYKSLDDSIYNVSEKLCRILEADLITFYKYNSATNIISVPPIMYGEFYDVNAMSSTFKSSDEVVKFESLSKINYIKYAKFNPITNRVSNNVLINQNFIEREQVESCVVVPIINKNENLLLGIMFINYRKIHDFTKNEKRIIETICSAITISLTNWLLKESVRDSSRDFTFKTGHALSSKVSNISTSIQMIKRNNFENIESQFNILWNDTKEALTFCQNFKRYGAINEICLNEEIKVNSDYFETFRENVIKNGISYNLNIDEDFKDVLIKGNIEYIKAAFQELTNNAIKHLKRGKTENPEVFISIKLSKKKIVILFKDNGPGIEKKYLKQIFLPFNQGGQSGNGVGLGLALVKDIIEKHNGMITVTSEIRKFTSFHIILPIL